MNNIQIDKLTEQCIGLLIEESNYKDKRLKHYNYLLKNMETIEKNTGLLTKDFIKRLIDREKELENEIFELNEKLKAYNSNTDNNEVPLGYNIFLNMIKYAKVNYNYGDSTYGDSPTISIGDYPLTNPDELDYISKIIKNDIDPHTYIGTRDPHTYIGAENDGPWSKLKGWNRPWY